MSDKEFPEEAEKTVYQRDKTAKEPVPKDSGTPKPKPKIKPKKVFVPKKATFKTDKPMEHRVLHLRVASKDSADLIRTILIDFQKELAEQPADDPDKEFHDREKVEKFFARVAKKYSACTTRVLGGELGWIHKGMKFTEEIMTEEMIDEIFKMEKHTISQPLRTQLGYHLMLICESRIHTPKAVEDKPEGPVAPPQGTNIPT
jgi:parvulin-like peptidyl-prolyl isomerase